METRYELTTIKDIFDKVPLEKIDLCMAEIAQGIKQAKIANEALKAMAAAMVVNVEAAIEFPAVITWVDDSKGEIVTKLVTKPGGAEIASIIKRPS